MDLVALTKQTLQTYLDKAAEIWGQTFPMPALYFSLRGRTAGQACYEDYWININLELFRNNPDHFINGTIPHELAHLIAWRVYGNAILKKPHGPHWQYVMRMFGLKPVRCHHLQTTPARVVKKQFRYICSCQKFSMTAIRHKRMLKGKTYHCRKCKKNLVFIGEIG